MTLGLLILLFVVYQLWGTGIFTARAQDLLKIRLQEAAGGLCGGQRHPGHCRPADVVDHRSAGPEHHDQLGSARRSWSGPPHRRPTEGDVEGTITIPRIGDQHGLRRGHVARRPEEGARPLSGDAAAGHDRQRRDRRSPHHLSASVLRRRQAADRRPDHHHDARRQVHVQDDATTDRCADRCWCRREHARRRADADDVQPARFRLRNAS